MNRLVIRLLSRHISPLQLFGFFVANLIGIAAPIVTGMVVDKTGSFAGAFLVTGAVIIAGIFCYTIVLGRIDRMPAPTATERI